MAGFTFEKLEKGKTEPQFLLKTMRKGSEKIRFLLIFKNNLICTCLKQPIETKKELRAAKADRKLGLVCKRT